MKTIFALTLCVVGYIAHAQQPCPPDIPYKETAYSILKNLDKSQVPTGILYENVLPIANIYEYTGNSGTDTSNTAHFLQAYAEIYLSAFNNTGMKHYLSIYDQIENFHPNRKYYHPIGIIDYNFNTIDPDAVNNNLLSLSNGQLYDVPNRPSSPYISEKAAIASALMAEEYPCLYPGQHFFTFHTDFVLTNSGFSLSQVTHLQAIYNGNTIYNSNVSGLDNFSLPLTVSNEQESTELLLIMMVNGAQKHYIISMCQIAVDPITACRGQDAIEIF